MAYTDLWKKLSSKQLNMAIQIVSLIAIFFEGFDQGQQASPARFEKERHRSCLLTRALH